MATKTDRLEIEIIASDHASDTLRGLGGSLHGVGLAAGIATGAVSSFVAVGLGAAVSMSLRTNAALETATLQFETLLGSSDKAKAHIAELYKFGAETPFETGPIIQASKSLLTFGGTALDTMDNLKMFGNAAAVTGSGIDEVAYTMGRAYTAIQAGKPFGEAAMRLQEMGILTAQGRAKLDELQKSGADSKTTWAALTSEFNRFDGAMKKQAGTWDGLVSTIKDNLNLALGTAFRPVFDAIKIGLNDVVTIISGPEFSTALQQISTQVAAVVSSILANLPGLIQGFQQSFGWLSDHQAVIVGAIAAIAATAIPAIIAFVTASAPVIAIMGAVGLAAGLLYQAWTTNFLGIQDRVSETWAQLQPIFMDVSQWLSVNVPIAINTLVSFWNGVLMPAMQNVWSWVSTNLIPLFVAIGRLIGTVVGLEIRILAGLFQNVLIPAAQAVWNFLSPVLIPTFQTLGSVIVTVGGWISNNIVPAFWGITGAIQSVIGWINDLIGALNNIHLPDWLTPGSPTPFELGLRGISSAMGDLTTGPLPSMASQLDFGGRPAPFVGASGSAYGAVGATIVLQYQPVFSMTDEEELRTKLQPMLNRAIRTYNRGTSP